MIIKTDKPLIFFDLETTGTELTSRIIQIAAIKFIPVNGLMNFSVWDSVLKLLVNPGTHIPEDATAIHGITDEMIKEAPQFEDLLPQVRDFFIDCDIAGFNILNFDVPVLAEHFAECGSDFPFPGTRFIDASVIIRKNFPRTLAAAYYTYTGDDMSTVFQAHDALDDSKATLQVLGYQISKHYQDKTDIETLQKDSLDGRVIIDPAGKFSRDKDGDIIFTFGSNKDKKVSTNPGMLSWMLMKDFPKTTKNIIRAIQKGDLK